MTILWGWRLKGSPERCLTSLVKALEMRKTSTLKMNNFKRFIARTHMEAK